MFQYLYHRVFILLFVIAFSLISACYSDTENTPDWLTSCKLDGVDTEALCGKFLVNENREASSGQRIGLRVVVLPALEKETRLSDPVFFFEGGPGLAASELIPDTLKLYGQLRQNRDLVFVDQRGTGSSNPLDCPSPKPQALQDYFADAYSADAATRCKDSLSDIDLRQYTTPVAMDDIDELRQALGYRKINVAGSSYGTRAALVYMRQYPNAVRSSILHGVAPTTVRNSLPSAKALHSGLHAVFKACQMEPACKNAFPKLREDWNSLLAEFAEGSISINIDDNGKNTILDIPRGAFAEGLRYMLYSNNTARYIPLMITLARQHNFDLLIKLQTVFKSSIGQYVSRGMFYTVVCTEDIQFISENDIRIATEGTFLGDYKIRQLQDACGAWVKGAQVSENFIKPVTSDIPSLLLSGADDPATPPHLAAKAANFLSNSVQIVFPNQSHDVENAPCFKEVVTKWINELSSDVTALECIDDAQRPPFVTSLN